MGKPHTGLHTRVELPTARHGHFRVIEHHSVYARKLQFNRDSRADPTPRIHPLPYQHTCEGQPFASGASPKLVWKKAPKHTKSYAIALKDLTVFEGSVPNRAFHSVAWDIPHTVTSAPEALG